MDERIGHLLCEMAEPAARPQAASRLAHQLGAESLIAFVVDTEIGQLLPANGFPQSLPGGPEWSTLLERCRTAGVHAGTVPYPTRDVQQMARALVLADGTAFMLIGGDADPSALSGPESCILAALLRMEQRASSAEARGTAAQETARHTAELMAAVDNARAAAEQAMGAKNEFLAMLGHELRNPLSPIVTALQLLRLRGDFDTRSELSVIERQVEHLVTLVDDLMDVARITRGKVELKLEDVELSHVVIAAVEMASPLLERRRHEFHLDVPRSGLRVRGDALRLKQIVANLLTNSAKYTEPGGSITLHARRAGEDVVLCVTDNGIGISPDLLPKVFELFTQGRRSSDRSEGGLGIGLALVRNLVKLHGGSVTAASEGPGRGSTFTVRLPVLPVGEPVPVAPQAERGLIKPTGARRVLVVDDNLDAAQMLALVLSHAGHEVAIAHDGATAQTTAATFHPEVAILDIGLPVMNGYELAKLLRARLPSPPRLIALTGYGQPQDRVRSSAAGFDLHLVKPVDPEQILAAIQQLLRAGTEPDPRQLMA